MSVKTLPLPTKLKLLSWMLLLLLLNVVVTRSKLELIEISLKLIFSHHNFWWLDMIGLFIILLWLRQLLYIITALKIHTSSTITGNIDTKDIFFCRNFIYYQIFDRPVLHFQLKWGGDDWRCVNWLEFSKPEIFLTHTQALPNDSILVSPRYGQWPRSSEGENRLNGVRAEFRLGLE